MSRRAVEPAPFFALRTPLLPLAELHALSDGLRAPGAGAASLAAALDHDRARVRERLRALVDRPEVREALFLASPSLDESLPVWREQPDSERGQKVERALVRYLARLCARPTPFGLFAGCSVGTIGEHTRLELDGRAAHRRHTRLDGDYLSRLCEALGRDPAVRRALVHRPNSSLYRAAGRLRYAEARLDGNERTYHLVAVEPSEAILATLERARDGARLNELAAALVDDDITLEEAAAFVDELVEAQLLVSDLQPQVTGDGPLAELIEQLRAQPDTVEIAAVLDEVRRALAALDAAPPGTPPSGYRALADRLRALPAEVELSRLFQVDLVKPALEATLGRAPLDELTRVVSLLHRIAAPREDGPLAAFRAAFAERYQDREVPLAEALDEESGIGFDRARGPDADPSPLLDGLPVGGGRPPEAPRGRWLALLLGKLDEALRTGADEIVLTEAELERLADGNPPPLPDSLAATVVVVAPSAEAVDAGELRLYLESVGGPSGANLLGRFCHGDPALTAHVRAHLREEESRRPDAVFAEVVHLPEGRIGNVILRPLLREHEIALLGRSGAPAERQLRIDDLTVAVVDGRVRLRSRRLGREIIPRLTTAHLFTDPRNLGLYRFLCALQGQDVAQLGLGWGALAEAPYLPRLRVGRTVLQPHRWRLVAAELAPLGEGDRATRFARVQALRRRARLPRWVALADADQVLPIDLDNVLSVETLVHLVHQRQAAVLMEVVGADGLVAHGPEGAFTHELVVPLSSVAGERRAPPLRPGVEEGTARHFLPGSEWLYAKLYTGTAGADELLREVVAPVLAGARAAGAVDGWFFLRYADPDWHLRVRFHGEPRRLLGEVLPALHAAAAPALAAGTLWRLQLDTYARELERYGGPDGMAAAEALFCADSDAALAILETLDGDGAADARWRITLRGLDQLLEDLGFDLDGRHTVVARARDGFAREFDRHAERLPRAIGARFRRERPALEALLDRDQDGDSPFEPALQAFAARSQRVRPIAAIVRAHAAAGRLSAPLEELAASYLHLSCNRLLRGSARAQERVLYDFLTRLYEGRRARVRRSGGP